MGKPSNYCPICNDFFFDGNMTADAEYHYWWHKLEELVQSKDDTHEH